MPSQPRRRPSKPAPSTEIDRTIDMARPRLVALIFCDWANVTTDQKFNLIGTFDRITVSASDKRPPLFALYIRLANTLEDDVHLQVYNPDGTSALEGRFKPQDISSSVHNPIFLQIAARLQFEAEQDGLYWFEVLYQGQSLGGTALTVQIASSEEQEANATGS